MLKQECPWCKTKVATHQLGNRAPKVKPKWYGFTKNVSVCPYCNNQLRVNPKSTRWLVLFTPLLLVFVARVFLGHDILPASPYNEIGFALAVAGVVASLFTMRFEKAEDL